MNQVNFIGNLTADPNHRVAGTTTITTLRVALDRRNTNGEPVYIDVVVFDNQAEAAARYLTKGRQVAVSGRLDLRTWRDEGGSIRSRHQIIAHDVQFLA
jgi:single-strand DNA-binding protein